MLDDSGGFSLSSFAVRHPHFTIVSCILVSLLGVLALVELPRDLLPPANMPAVQVLSFYPGMPVENIENDLTARFERYTGQAVGMVRQESRSLMGVSVIRNFFNPETDLSSAIAQTTSLAMSVLRRLPPGTQPPMILPFDPMASVPMALVAVSGEHSEKELYDMARYDVGNTIQSVRGAIAPTVMGGAERQILIFADPKKLSKFNLSPLELVDKLNRLNTFIPAGDIKVGDLDYQIVSNGMVQNVAEMDTFPLRSQFGTAIYINEVGHAADAHKVQTNIVTIDGKKQVYVPVYRQPGANSIRIIDEMRAKLDLLQTRLGNYSLKIVADQSYFIRKAINSISKESIIGGGIAALLVFLFLGDARAMFGVMLSLPLSIFFAFLGLRVMNQSLNAMTLGGLALSIGVLVDNAIVVLENIANKLKTDAYPMVAAVEGSNEVAMPVLTSTLATLVIFFPVIFLDGMVKILFGALGVTVIFAMIGSYLASLTIVPLYASRFLRKHVAHENPKGVYKVTAFFDSQMTRLASGYQTALEYSLKNRSVVLAGLAVLLLCGFASYFWIGTELFPRADAGSMIVELRLDTGVRIETTEKTAVQIEKEIRTWIDPADLEMIIMNAGVVYGLPAAYTPNSGPQDFFFDIELKENRKHTSQYYAKIIRQNIKTLHPGIDMGVELGGLLTSALNGGLRSPVDIQVEGPDVFVSHQIATDLKKKFELIRGAVDVRVQQRLDAPEYNMEIDRKKAADIGLTVEDIIKDVASAVSGSATFNQTIWIDPKTGIDYLLGVQFPEKDVSTLAAIRKIPITSRAQDRSVELGLIASFKETRGANEINHVNLQPVIDLYMDAQDRDIGGLSADAAKIIEKSTIPAGYTVNFRGETAQIKHNMKGLIGGFILAAILVYLILVVQFESFMYPLITLSTVPMGIAGNLTALALTHTYFSIQAAIGAIFTIGVAVAHGVLLIEYIIQEEKNNGASDQAIVAASKMRLRPILMTSLASILALIPMAMGFGHGAEPNIPLGRSVIGGQITSTLLTLFAVPLFFQMLRDRNSRHDEKMRNLAVREAERLINDRLNELVPPLPGDSGDSGQEAA